MSYSDFEIIDKVLSGDIDKFELLIDKYKNNVYRIVSSNVPSDDIDEVANDIFFKVYKSLASYKRNAPFINWLSVISVRTCKTFWRNRYNDKVTPISAMDVDIDYLVNNIEKANSPEADMLKSELATTLELAMDRLKPSERIALNLMHVEGRSVSEISELMEITESNVKVTVYRAKKKLINILNNDFGEITT